jgi:hypothetical protein
MRVWRFLNRVKPHEKLMSAHYTFMLNLPLAPEAAAANADILRYVLNNDASRPSSLPPHKFFDTFNPAYRFHNSYRNFQPGAWQSAFWTEINDDSSSYAGVSLCLPGNKLEGVVQDLFSLGEWLATMSNAKGPVGIVVAEDLSDSEPMILFVRDRRLYVGTSNPAEARAVDDGSPYRSEV